MSDEIGPIRKTIYGLLAATAVAAPLALGATAAHADVSTNGTTKDAHGYCNANHIANFNGDHNGIGWIRSEQTGKQIAQQNKNLPDFCVTSQGQYAPISNNG